MKKISSLIATLAVMFFPLVIGGVASAAGTCEIGFTGPDSNNICTSKTTFACNITNINKLTVYDDNDQIAATGTSNDGVTGTATNANGVTYTATITGGTDCVAVATVPATVTPAAPGAGAVTGPQAPQKAAARPAVLPNTASDSPLMYVAAAIGILGVGALLSRTAVLLYGHVKG